MDGLGKFDKFEERLKKSKGHLHSPDHILADELSTKLRDPKHFGFYLKTAMQNDHAVLRRLLGEVLEAKDVRSPGKLFAFLLKKYHQEQKNK